MRRRLLAGAALWIASICGAQRVYAGPVVVNLFPSSPLTVNTSPAMVNVNVSGLGVHADPTIGAFDVTLFYDPAVLSPGTPVFSTLLNPITPCPFCQVVTTPQPGAIELAEVSLATDAQLQAAQSAAFTLVQVPFTALVSLPTTTTVSLQKNYLADGNGNLIPPPVPEPATWALSFAGLAMMVAWRRRRC